ncbi:hypothetical protein Agabi119p4_9269 [Agaricus bisporus var. burnettii]|uniref:Uncharacterized protein n=1 Tax=Agaricus bisporus var. burnettii TaxID=192524 RepID=A0A8H7C596_AGABI|nr:hypothetical protein Agabi119p4_9269 [Agaricus bisporus var. burnettii]
MNPPRLPSSNPCVTRLHPLYLASPAADCHWLREQSWIIPLSFVWTELVFDQDVNEAGALRGWLGLPVAAIDLVGGSIRGCGRMEPAFTHVGNDVMYITAVMSCDKNAFISVDANSPFPIRSTNVNAACQVDAFADTAVSNNDAGGRRNANADKPESLFVGDQRTTKIVDSS